MLITAVQESAKAELTAGTELPNSVSIGLDLGTLAGIQPAGAIVGSDPESLFIAVDCVIDFTIPDATLSHARLAQETGTSLVIGTTGLDEVHMKALKEAGGSAAVVYSGNMSLGVNILLGLVEQAARSLSSDYDIEVLEMHHKHKIDAPSGTALMLGRAAAKGREISSEGSSVMSRVGETGPRPSGAIGYATLRGGDVIGEHSVILAGAGERIELTHKANDRALFAKGAVHAALWTKGQLPGFYTMGDVLSLN